MKLRRAMAVAAATAVLTPLTLLSATAAVATPSPTPTTSETSPAPEESETSPAPQESETSPAPQESETSPAPEESETSPAPEESETSPAPQESATTPAPSATPTSPADICNGEEEPTLDKNLRTTLSGLPSKVVAGSGFHGFELNVANKGDSAYKRVDLGVFAAQVDTDTWEETTGHLTLQFKNPDTGQWTDISLDENDEGAGYLGYTDVRAQESFSIDMRLSVGKNAPEGFGFAISIGVYADDKGNCVFAGTDSFYEFDILAAGAEPGNVNDAEPQEGGKKPLPVKPAGGTEINPEGTLAQTGSDSNLPVIATIGGLAILAGAGVVFGLKRRRPNATPTA
ncbi:LPXTG cell wall anchor domain-containing protein [Streptomyces sp. NPDC048142]|uniref:LPXTG cell wall anchor domain-containing protein n=1 Tax=Streptomyces sp. NPDC048142 TaxID=3365501 RepID=UPI00371AF38E